jgi:hypothetical protein
MRCSSYGYIGLDVDKKTMSYSVKEASWQVHQQSKIGATRNELYGFVRLDEDFSRNHGQ